MNAGMKNENETVEKTAKPADVNAEGEKAEKAEKGEKKKKKAKKIFLTALLVLVLLAAAYMVFNAFSGRIFHSEFYAASEKVQTVPDLWGGFLPQGVTKLDGKTLLCGYTSSEASRIYVLENGAYKKLYINAEDGGIYDGHAGGITAHGGFVYISNASKIFVLRAKDILSADNEGKVAIIGHFDLPSRSSFCSCDGKYLYVGEFHRKGYETDASHAVKSADGDYQAMIFAYELSQSERYGVKKTPAIAYAVCDEAQGGAFDGGRAAISCSYGLSPSRLRFYNVTGEADGTFDSEGAQIPLYILDSKREQRTVEAPHMSEDVEFVDGKLLIAFEAGALKYGGGVLPCSERSVMLFDPDHTEGS